MKSPHKMCNLMGKNFRSGGIMGPGPSQGGRHHNNRGSEAKGRINISTAKYFFAEQLYNLHLEFFMIKKTLFHAHVANS